MRYDLRPYQVAMSGAIVRQFDSFSKKPFLAVAGTGAGKSIVIADVCHKLDAPTVILAPTGELVGQNKEKLESYGITDIGVYSASLNSKEVGKYTLATIGSVVKHPELFKDVKYFIIDECDLVDPKSGGTMYKKFLKHFPDAKICGLTATPYRIESKFVEYNGENYYTATLKMVNRIWDRKANGTFWGNIVYKIETPDLIEQGYLAPIVYHTDEVQLDLLKVNSTGADYTATSLDLWGGSQVDRIVRISKAIDQKCQRNLIFCSSIKQAYDAFQVMAGEGLKVQVVTGQTPKRQRAQAVADFKAGKIRHLLNVGVFLAGFDVPEVDSIIMVRPTMSLRLWYQAIGRGVRLDPNRPNKKLHVFDIAGVSERLGRVETIRLSKEDGYKDIVVSEVGRMDERALFSFKLKPKEKKANGASKNHKN